MQYEQDRVTPDNFESFLGERVSSGDMLLDLAWNIDNPTILQWCRDHNVRYLNTSVEVWDPYLDLQHDPPDRSHAVRPPHATAPDDAPAGATTRAPSAVVEHGANPGLVSHFAKQALREICSKILSDGLAGPAPSGHRNSPGRRHATTCWPSSRGTKVIHISERDTQITNVPKEFDEFVNTWSVDGFYEEGVAPAEWVGVRMNCACPPMPTPIRRRATQSDLHGPAGHGHLGSLLGAVRTDRTAWSFATARR